MTKPKYTTFTGIQAADIPAKLSERFPPEAYKAVSGVGADLTDISTGFMIERITQVFGPKGLGWNLLYNPDSLRNTGDSGRIVVRLDATFLYSLWDDQGNKIDCAFPVSSANENRAQFADEGARTSCIGSALKWLCFQIDIYKGVWDHHDAQREAAETRKQAQTQVQAAKPAPRDADSPNTPKPDDDEPAAANWEGVELYRAMFAKALKVGIKADVITPGKTTKGEIRKLYTALAEQVNSAEKKKA